MHVFQLLLTIKVKLLDEMMQVLIHMLLYMSNTKKLPFISVLT